MKIWKNLGLNQKEYKSMDENTILFLESCKIKSNFNSFERENSRKKIL